MDEARRDEALKQQEVMRRELRAAHTQFTERAKLDTQRAVAEALSAHMKKKSKVLESKVRELIMLGAFHAAIPKSCSQSAYVWHLGTSLVGALAILRLSLGSLAQQ